MKDEMSHSNEENNMEHFEVYQVRFQVPDTPDFLKDLRLIGKEFGCSLICFNRQVMAGRKHVITSVLRAERAFQSGNPISRSIEVEALLYAAGTRQTGLIGAFGVHEGLNECYLCIIPKNKDAREKAVSFMESAEEEDWEQISGEKEADLQRLFSVTEEELLITGRNRLQDLVLERVALLMVNR